MTKKQIFIGAGSVVLAVAAFLSTNANKKFAGTGTAYFHTVNNVNRITLFKAATSVTHLTTVKGSLKTAFFSTINLGTKTLFAKKTVSGGLIKTLFYKP